MKSVIILFFLSLSFHCISQEKDSLRLDKGIWISGVQGGISNSRVLGGSGSQVNQSVDYSFNLNSGFFLSPKVALGANFSLEKKGETRSSQSTVSEEFHIGPWARYYIEMQPNWCVYPELGISYVNYFSSIYDDSSDWDAELSGHGIGVRPGIAIVYFLGEAAAFNISWSYQWNLIQGDFVRKDGGDEIEERTVSDLQLGTTSLMFGFQLYLHEFFF